MGEHWTDDFFKLSEPKQRERGGVVVASTTDSQVSLNQAARERHEAETDDTVTYTEVLPVTPNVDGSVEHGALLVKSNIPERDEDDPCALEKMTPAERTRS